jgi:protein-disulfide isomerase
MVRYVAMNLPLALHPNANAAAEAAECAAKQGKFWEMHDVMFTKQKEIATADYAAYARDLGIDTARFETCLESDDGLAKVMADQAVATRLDVKSTPTLFIGRVRPDGGVDLLRRIGGAYPFSVFVDEIAKLRS